MATSMQQRRGTSAQWAAANPILKDGEFGFEKDTGVVKVGNGTSTWNVLQPILGSSYLPMLGKANDAERLDGYDSTAFVLKNETSATATNSSYVQRDAAAKILATPGAAAGEVVTYEQTTSFGRDRGSGTVFPTTDLRRGDMYDHRGINCLFIYSGTVMGWRQAGTCSVANNVGRGTLISNYGTLLHEGFKVWHDALKVEMFFDRTAMTFRFRLSGWGQYNTDGSALVYVVHGAGQQPRNFPIGSTMFSQSEGQNQVLKWVAWSGTNNVNLIFRAYNTDTSSPLDNPNLGLVWSCDF